MMVRRYVVKDMPEAIALIRKDLGKDAVILSTKKIALTKWMGLWRSKRIEVLAATGDGVPVRVSPARTQSLYEKSTPEREPRSQPDVQEGQLSVRPNLGTEAPSAVQAQTMPAVEKQPTTPVVVPTSVVPSVETGDIADHRLLADVFKEISDVKKLLTSTLPSAAENPLEDAMFRHLMKQGMTEGNIRTLLHSSVQDQRVLAKTHVVSSELNTDAKPASGLRDVLGNKILENLQDLSISEPIEASSRIVALVGPTGVGKTTTIAKLAALHVLAGNRKVGLITTDTFRIAAVEQLRTYANILNVPLQVVYQPGELPAALEQLSHCDLILMDTAGRNFHFNRNVLEIKTVLSAIAVDETYLVMSMTSKPDDLDRIAAAFNELPIDKFLFTKMDETSTYGSILNLLMTYRKPMSYVTTGQNVPDDIEVANIEKVLRLILGGAA